ncbi:hypothetical protein [Mesonia sp.]|uniref:hypothetical protein n=1 Tax=Mesonia sp. TaxID=1960830 RepID=UPI003F944B86
MGVNTINDDYYYNIPGNDRFRLDHHVQNNSNNPDLMKLDAINMYLVQGEFQGQASRSYAMTTININAFFNGTGIIGHEMGHVFGLSHTHASCEHVTRNVNDPNYDAPCTGDRVVDTNAVPSFTGDFENFSDGVDVENQTYIGAITNCHQETYDLVTWQDITNFMAYSNWNLQDHFSIGQAIRMRESIIVNNSYYNNKFSSNTIDIYVRNSTDDVGVEPDIHSNMILWRSPDIWVRNQADGFVVQEHENAEYDPNNPVYVYVRINNKSCQDFVATPIDTLKLHWAKASTSLGWPTLWDGSTSNPTLGAPINAVNLPNIAAGESEIVEFEWYPPNPVDFESISNDPWHFCLLARILSPQDPMNVPEQAGQNNAYYNNNIANKNISIVDLNEDLGVEPGATVLIGNPVKTYPVLTEFEFFPPQNDPHPILEEAEVIVTLDDYTWNLWLAGGKKGIAVREVKGGGNKLRILSKEAKISNIMFGGKEWGTMHLSFNFLTEEVTNKPNYLYHLKQIESESGIVTGGESYEIIPKFNRLMFMAQGDQVNNTTNQPSILQAAAINEPAIYNWYDEEGNLMHSGQQLNVNSAIAQTYKLEIIAEADGYKDYTNIYADSSYKLQSLSPNPASSQVTVNYQTAGADSGYINITSTQTAISNNYILDVNAASVNIDVSAYPTGTYVVALNCNGEIVETKNLIIQ